jgi:hypothetical protein
LKRTRARSCGGNFDKRGRLSFGSGGTPHLGVWARRARARGRFPSLGRRVGSGLPGRPGGGAARTGRSPPMSAQPAREDVRHEGQGDPRHAATEQGTRHIELRTELAPWQRSRQRPRQRQRPRSLTLPAGVTMRELAGELQRARLGRISGLSCRGPISLRSDNSPCSTQVRRGPRGRGPGAPAGAKLLDATDPHDAGREAVQRGPRAARRGRPRHDPRGGNTAGRARPRGVPAARSGHQRLGRRAVRMPRSVRVVA